MSSSTGQSRSDGSGLGDQGQLERTSEGKGGWGNKEDRDLFLLPEKCGEKLAMRSPLGSPIEEILKGEPALAAALPPARLPFPGG
ncbi:hypothetical protein STEG23_017392 [Scotinomys teguina]